MRWAWLLALVAAGALLFWLGGRTPSSPRPPSSEQAPLPARAEFVGSGTCLSCHEAEHAGWLSSAHAHALRPPDAAKGAFDGTPVGESTPRRDGAAFAVKVDARDRRVPGYHRVTWVVGGRTEELYLFTDARGAWRVMPIAWNVARKAWDETLAVYEALTGDPAPEDARQIVFNRDCAACHATGFDPGFRPAQDDGESFDSTFAEPGVGCEACHGAASVHVLWHEQKRGGAYEAPAKLIRGGPGGCQRCHYEQEMLFAPPADAGGPFEETAVSRNFDGTGFLPDGRRSAARHAATPFASSACARGGATCLSCHAVHGEARPQGDAACTACHVGLATKEHTRHEDVRCADCHMPRLLAAPLEAMRDHSIRSPEPALTERFGIPNACNACHNDKDVAWAREAKERWYGPPDERLLRDTAVVADLRKGSVEPERLAEIARDPRSPPFFRATALRALPLGDAALRETLGDAEIELVQVACEALAERPDPLAAPALVGLLGHRARTVRILAAHALARTGWRAEAPMPGLRDDAIGLFSRRYPATPRLVLAAWIHEALGGSDDMALVLPTLARRVPMEAAPLIQRRGRDLAQKGQHTEALIAYDDARRILGEATPPLLHIDSADSFSAAGDGATAERIWQLGVERFDPASVEHAIARARLLGLEGRGEEGRAILDPFAKRLATDPAGAEMLIRVRWSLEALRSR